MSSSDTDPTDLEREHQKEADKLEEQSKNLGQDIDDVSQDWQQKRASQSVPGAKTPPDSDEEDEEDSDEEERDEEESEEDSDDEGSDEKDSDDEDSEDDSEDKSDDEDAG